MERYFLGSNTGYGYFGCYETELKTKNKVVLLKGGPGTGKSSLLKRIAERAKKKGWDFELWYCSGDPESLDGVFVKDANIAVVDATSPHASGADLPVIKDVIFDLASSIDEGKLMGAKGDIENLLNNKKQHFIRAYQHLKCALCHYHNQIYIETAGTKVEDIRAYAGVCASEIRKSGSGKGRRLFSRAICPRGESEYFDHLRDRNIFKVSGSAGARKIFFDELKGLVKGDLILNPLDPNVLDGLSLGGTVVTARVGQFAGEVAEDVNLTVYEGEKSAGAEEEREEVMREIALAKGELEKARENHLLVEKYFVGAMNFENNDKMARKIEGMIFGS